jgi:uncharacterized protein (TIGR02147 family)
VLESFLALEKAEVIKKNEEGKFVKSERYIKVPTSESISNIREFHNQMIEEAQKNLTQKTSDQDFQKRYISGVTVAVNPEKIELCKMMLKETLNQACLQLSDGECTEVYQVNIQLFPLSH